MNDEKTNDTETRQPDISTTQDLHTFLLNVRDKLGDRSAAPVYALSALNHVMNLPNVYDLLDKDNKEIARDIWLRLKQSGFQLKNPPLLFGGDGEDATANS